MNNFGEKANFLWSIAELLRDSFKRSKYQDVILPLTVLRRVDCVLEPTKQRVLELNARLKAKDLKNRGPQLCRASRYAFFNTSRYDFPKLLDDAPGLASNLKAYINGFSENMKEVLEKFDFQNTIAKLDEAGLLFLVMERFKNIDLHPDKVSNLEMGYIFEELIRRFNEALNENPGEHFTPREVIRLMVDLLLACDTEALRRNHIVRKVYDPCCGSGGMLTIAKGRILEINPHAEVYLYGQEVNPETFAVCKSDLLIKSRKGEDAENIKFGSTLSNDQLADDFDYLLANPPYGKEWKMDQVKVEAEHAKGEEGRFGAGLPRISDGQLLFLQHMLSRMNEAAEGGSRVGIVMNGSPLFTGDAGSGESEIRRWILENDWLEAIVALPDQLFYNTGINTYVWVLTNRKEKRRRKRVQLIDATSFWVPMRKSLGDKRHEISAGQIHQITEIHGRFEDGEHSRVFEREDFGYRRITVERPLRLNFQVSPERIERLKSQKSFAGLAVSKKKSAKDKAAEEAEGRKEQETILAMLGRIPATLFKDRPVFEAELGRVAKTAGLELAAPLRKAILTALSERDPAAEICRDREDHAEPDPDLRDTENVPLKDDIWAFFEREVKPHVPDAWINTAIRDHGDREVGKVGYEINFSRYFYKFQPPRPLEEIEADIKGLEKDILGLLREVAG